uniref:RNA polymerase sigma-70 domain-containing protein n=1 Tax=Glossina austeni TaxID=7395 RepID=A0A1A9UK72_GLOAU
MCRLFLGVNIDHVATLRNARGGEDPNPVHVAVIAESAGADGITVHLREDRRHIRENDLFLMKKIIYSKINLEMAPTENMFNIARNLLPHSCCLVPENREEITTENGLNVIEKKQNLHKLILKLKNIGIKVSIFLDPIEAQILAASEISADCIEINTAKEAASKALGTGMRKGLSFVHFEIIHDNLGKPYLKLHSIAKNLLKDLNITDIHLSLTDERKYACAMQYIPMIRHEALRLQVKLPNNVELDDLMQSGMIGFLSAIENFDINQGASFSTYARSRIRWSMLDELRERDWVPRSVRRNARDIASAIQRLEQRLGLSATEKQIADELGVSLLEYQKMLQETNCGQIFSLEDLGNHQETSGFKGMHIPEDNTKDPCQLLLINTLKIKIIQEIRNLPKREQILLNLYYQQELNLKEIGLVLGVGESRVSQLHSLAIKRLRARLKDNI